MRDETALEYCPYCGTEFESVSVGGLNGYSNAYCGGCDQQLTLRVERWVPRELT
jgi:transcription elongation factor Elf1